MVLSAESEQKLESVEDVADGKEADSGTGPGERNLQSGSGNTQQIWGEAACSSGYGDASSWSTGAS